MAVRVSYVARETGNNLLRNMLLTVASVITFTVSLAILGGAVLAIAAVDHAFSRWKDGVEFIIYMRPGAEQAQIDAVEKALKDSPQVATWDFVDTEATYKEFQDYFRDDPDIAQSVKPEELPQSFRVRPKNPKSEVVDELGKSFRSRGGVYKVEFALDAVKQLEQTFSRLSNLFLLLSIVLLAASSLLIVFMIQTAVFARRREIEVQRLVGATNWFIRIPFIMEGVVHALVGWVLATGSLALFTWAWRSQVATDQVQSFFGQIVWSNSDVIRSSIVLLVVSLAIGALGSTLSVSWYLKT